MLSSELRVDDAVFELTREALDDLPFGVITLDREGKILRFNRAEESLSRRMAQTTVGLDFFTDVAPCTNVQSFRGRFDDFSLHRDSGVEHFDFSFNFRWGRQDVSITMLRKAAHDEINILVRGHSMTRPIAENPVSERRRVSDSQLRSGITALRGELAPPSLVQPIFCRLGGAEEAALRAAIHPEDAIGVGRSLASAALARAPYAIEYRRSRPDGSIAVVEEFGSFAEPGAAAYATIIDVTQRRQTEQELWRAARYDRLTGLPNRSLLLTRIGAAVREAKENDSIAAILVANLDKFRAVNDMFGPEIGDLLLRMLSFRLGECVRGGDTVARLNGDRFAVLLTDAGSGLNIADTVTRLIAAASQPFIVDERAYYLTLSTGISVTPYDSVDPETLLRSADTAMCAAKAAGRNGFRWYGSEMSVDAAKNARSHNELSAALENNELELHYQPIVDVEQDRIVAVESLVRWNHPTRGFLPPVEFISLADRTGLIIPLGEWVLREACRQARIWHDSGLELRVCVNVSAVQFHQPNFVALVETVLRESGLEPGRLELELTESVMIDGFGAMMETLSRLKALGLRLAIDDFGTGYSSLAYLKYFPVDTLKIDRAFVIDIATDKFDRAIATAVFTLANQLELDCVVEGIEDTAQRDTLRAIGCTVMQGYYFCKPTTPARLASILGQRVSSLHSLQPVAAGESTGGSPIFSH